MGGKNYYLDKNQALFSPEGTEITKETLRATGKAGVAVVVSGQVATNGGSKNAGSTQKQVQARQITINSRGQVIGAELDKSKGIRSLGGFETMTDFKVENGALLVSGKTKDGRTGTEAIRGSRQAEMQQVVPPGEKGKAITIIVDGHPYKTGDVITNGEIFNEIDENWEGSICPINQYYASAEQ